MACWTRARVCGATWAKPLTTLETVRIDTPARSATWRRLAVMIDLSW
jgi:hypothetical protein